jgi:hypothetical protein
MSKRIRKVEVSFLWFLDVVLSTISLRLAIGSGLNYTYLGRSFAVYILEQ